MTDWKNMNDAPRDGTPVLVTVNDTVTEAFFCADTGFWAHDEAYSEDGEPCNVGLPIAWMELPKPFVSQEEPMIVARTILDQLGGTRRLSMMAGAKDFVAGSNSVSMKLPSRGAGKTINGCTHMRVVLNGMDTYDVEFNKWNSRKCEMGTVSKHDGIYNDMLMDLFEKETGLLLTISPRR